MPSYLLCHCSSLFEVDIDIPEGECCERAVGFVAVDVAHGGAPEVIAEHMAERAEPQDILILSDSGNVVMHKVPWETVEITTEGHYSHHAVYLAVITANARFGFSGPRGPGCGRLGESTWRAVTPGAPRRRDRISWQPHNNVTRRQSSNAHAAPDESNHSFSDVLHTQQLWNEVVLNSIFKNDISHETI